MIKEWPDYVHVTPEDGVWPDRPDTTKPVQWSGWAASGALPPTTASGDGVDTWSYWTDDPAYRLYVSDRRRGHLRFRVWSRAKIIEKERSNEFDQAMKAITQAETKALIAQTVTESSREIGARAQASTDPVERARASGAMDALNTLATHLIKESNTILEAVLRRRR